MTIAEIRQKYPQYSDLSDGQLVSALHKKYYSDMPVQDFHQKVGYSGAKSPYEPIGTTLGMAIPRALQRGGQAVQESISGGAEQIGAGREELLGNRPLSGLADLAMGGVKVVAAPFIGAFETANGLMHGTPLQPMAEAINAPAAVYEHFVPHSDDPGLEKLRELGGFAAGAAPFIVGEGMLAARKPMPPRLPSDFNIAEAPPRVLELPPAQPQLALPPSTRFEVYPGGTVADRHAGTPVSPVAPFVNAPTPAQPKLLPPPTRFVATPGGRLIDVTHLSDGEVAAMQQAAAFSGRPVEPTARIGTPEQPVPLEMPKPQVAAEPLALPPASRFEVYPGGTAVDRFSPTPTSPVDPMLLASPLPMDAPTSPLALPSGARFTAYPGGTIRDAFALPPVADQAPMMPMERPVPPQMPKLLPAPTRFVATPGGRIADVTQLSEGEVAALQRASAFSGRPVEPMPVEAPKDTASKPTPVIESPKATAAPEGRVRVRPDTDELIGVNERGEQIFWSKDANTHYSLSDGKVRTAPWVEGLTDAQLTRLGELSTKPEPATVEPAEPVKPEAPTTIHRQIGDAERAAQKQAGIYADWLEANKKGGKEARARLERIDPEYASARQEAKSKHDAYNKLAAERDALRKNTNARKKSDAALTQLGNERDIAFGNLEQIVKDRTVKAKDAHQAAFAETARLYNVRAGLEKDSTPAVSSTKRSRISSQAGSAINPAEVILDTAEAVRRLGKRASDFVTINPVPGLRNAGSEAAAREHYSARIAAPYIVKDLWSKVLPEGYDDPAAIAKITDLANKNNLLGLYDQLRSEAQEARLSGDKTAISKAQDALGGFERVHLQDIPRWERELKAARQNPELTEAGKRWNETVVPLMDRLYNEAKSVDPETPRDARGRYPELPARINLLPKWREAELGQWADPQKPMPEGQTANFRNPDVRRDAFMRKAAGTAVEYSTDGELVLLNALGRRWNEVTKLRLYNDLVKQGAAKWADETNGKPEGYSSLPVQVPETDPATGRTRQVSRNLFVKNEVIGEVRDVLDTDQRAPHHPIAKALNEVQLTLSLADATAHTKNMLSVLSNTLGRDAVWKDLLTRLPGVSTADALADIVKYSRMLSEDAPATRAKLSDMAKNGMIRPEFPQTPAGKIINPAQRLIHMVDTASRMALYDRYDSLIEHYGADPSMMARRDFVQQMGEYNRRAMGPAQKWLKDFGASPFIVAGRTFNRYGKRLVTGDPGFKSETNAGALKARAIQLGTVASVVALPALVNYLRTGNAFGRPGTPLGAVDTGETDEKGHPVVLDVMQLSGARRGLRAYGIEPFVEAAAGRRQGQTFNDMIGEGMQSAIQTASHPWMGPAPGFAYSTLTGHRLDLRGGPSLEQAHATEGKGTDYLERAKFAAQAQNPQLYSLYQATTGNSLDGQTTGEALQKGWLKAPMSAAGVRSVQSPAERALSEALSKAWSGKSMTEEQASKSRLRSDLIAQARQNGGRLPASLPAQYGDMFGKTQFRNMARDAGESWFDAGFRKLDDVPAALKVYEMRKHDDLTPKQSEHLRLMMAVNVARSSLTIGEKQAIFKEHPEIAPRSASWVSQN